MNRINRLLVTGTLLLSASSAFAAGTAPEIKNVCVTWPQAGLVRMSGMVVDAQFDALAVAPLVVGICGNQMPNVTGVSYVCEFNIDQPAPGSEPLIGNLVAVDKQGNFSQQVFFELKPGCTWF